MFKKIKKLYFKIYHLFKLLSVFILVFSFNMIVNADECENLLNLNEAIWYKQNSSGGWEIYYSLDGTTPTTITTEAGKTYTLFIPNNTEASINDYLCNNLNVCNSTVNLGIINFNLNNKAPTWSYITTNNTFKFTWLTLNNVDSLLNALNNKELKIYLVLGNTECTPPEEPEEPDTPDDTIYNSFISLYTNKISYLAEGFNTYESFKYFIGIIILFIILEITRRIINIRRVKK